MHAIVSGGVERERGGGRRKGGAGKEKEGERKGKEREKRKKGEILEGGGKTQRELK